MRPFFSGLALLLIPMAALAQEPPPIKVEPLINSNISGVADHKALIARVIIPVGGIVAAHYHPNEEFLYIEEGSTLLRIDGQPDKLIKAGSATVIPAGTVHTAINNGETDAKAIVFRVHPDGKPIRLSPELKNNPTSEK